jgi:hypothetical protein
MDSAFCTLFLRLIYMYFFMYIANLCFDLKMTIRDEVFWGQSLHSQAAVENFSSRFARGQQSLVEISWIRHSMESICSVSSGATMAFPLWRYPCRPPHSILDLASNEEGHGAVQRRTPRGLHHHQCKSSENFSSGVFSTKRSLRYTDS